MTNKTAVITGASTGLGQATARLFLEKGFNIVVNSLHENNLKQEFGDTLLSENVVLVPGDISDKKTGRQLVEKAIEKFGSVDVLVNNAGIFAPKPFLEVEDADIDKFINVNLKGTFFTSQAAIKEMLKKKSGVIINIGTVLVDHAIAGLPVTAPMVSKGGIHALTRQLAAEFAKDNIRVCTIAPGMIRSPLQAKIGVENADDLAGLHLLERVGEPNDIAEAVYFLANANFITGETIRVDGGHVAGHKFG